MESEDEEYDEESEYEEIKDEENQEMDENELSDIMSEPHQNNVPNESNRNHNVNINLQNDNGDPVENETNEDSKETRSEDEKENNSEDWEKEEEVTEEETIPTLHQSNRLRTPNPRHQHLTTSNVNTAEVYTEETGAIIAMTMCHFYNKLAGMSNEQTVHFLQTYSLRKG